jgi:hypothetical protein
VPLVAGGCVACGVVVAGGGSAARLFAGLEALDRGNDLRVVAEILDEEDLAQLDDHRLARPVELRPALEELTELLRLRRIGVRRQVEDVDERDGLIRGRRMAEEDLAAGQEHRLVGVPVDLLRDTGRALRQLAADDGQNRDRHEHHEQQDDAADRGTRDDDRAVRPGICLQRLRD